MTVYLIIYVFVILCSIFKWNIEQRTFLYFIVIILLSIVAAERGNLGSDTMSYVQIYNSIPPLQSLKLFPYEFKQEFGFIIFGSLIKSLGLSHVFFFLGISLWINIIYTIIVLKLVPKGYRFISILFFFCFFYLHYEFNVLRQGMMVMSVWMAFTYTLPNNLSKYILWILIGCSFHIVALFFIPFYWLLRLNYSLKYVIIMIGLSIFLGKSMIIFKLFNSVIPADLNLIDYYISDNGYYAGKESKSEISIGLIMYIILLIMSYLRCFSIENKNFKLIRNALIWAIALFFILRGFSVFVERIVNLLYLSVSLLLPNMLSSIRNKNIYNLFYGYIICYTFLLLWKNAHILNYTGKYQFLPYSLLGN